MRRIILFKLGEVALKGQNRRRFEKLLLDGVRRACAPVGDFHAYIAQSTGYVEPRDGAADVTAAYAACKKVFGISTVCLAALCDKDMDAIYRTVDAFLGPRLREIRTFKVEAKRADKQFPLRSPEICAEMGGRLLGAFPHLKVDVRCPDAIVYVEIRERYACIHELAEKGEGGMPTGSGGRGMLLISGGIDSPVAGYMLARRGVVLNAVHFFSYPYTSERARDKVITLLKKVAQYSGRIHLHIVPFTEIQERMREKVDEEYFTLVMRAFMMKIADRVAKDTNCGALITGESLGQVASQTMEALAVTNSFCTLPVLRPVIGMDKEDIVRIARRIDTFETSILPYEDCCTVFTPRHPKTKPQLNAVLRQLHKLDADALIDRAVEGIEWRMIEP